MKGYPGINGPPGNLTTLKDLRLAHTIHCLDYVRQGIQCAGDVTLEEKTQVGTEGFISFKHAHQCRSYEYLWDYVEQHS
jgi:hypothetical protein